MSLVQTINYDTPGNFTYDSALIEFSGALARLKSQRPAGATFGATFTSSANGSWGDGTLTATLVGGAAASGGKLVLTGGTNKYADWPGASNASGLVQTGAIKFKYTPNYTGNPASTQMIAVISQASGSTNNALYFSHSNTGNLTMIISSSAGAAIVNTTFGTYSAVAGAEVEFEINFDLTTGATRVFKNGVQAGSTATNTGTRSSNIGLIRTGDWVVPGTNPAANFSIDDIVIYPTVQHTANYTPGYTLPDSEYSITNPSLINNSGVNADDLISFAQTITISGSDAVKYTINVAAIDKYWNGAAWITSAGTYAQANTAAEILANLDTLDISAGYAIKVRAFLHSSDGSTRPTITQNTLSYDFFDPAPTAPTECVVFGHLADILGDVRYVDAKFIVKRAKSFFYGSYLISPSEKSVVVDDSGEFDISVIETTSLVATVNYLFKIQYTNDAGEIKSFTLGYAKVPNSVSANISTMTFSTADI